MEYNSVSALNSPGGVSNISQDAHSGEELPDMAPVCIRSDIPELQGEVATRVLADKDLTWNEYISMFGVHLSPEEYYVKGSGNCELSLDSKIGDYIDRFKRNFKVHPVSIEKYRKREVKVDAVTGDRTKSGGKRKRRSSPKRKRVRESKKSKMNQILLLPQSESSKVSSNKFTNASKSESVQPSKEQQVPPTVQTAAAGTQIRTPKVPSTHVSPAKISTSQELSEEPKVLPNLPEMKVCAEAEMVQINSGHNSPCNSKDEYPLNSHTTPQPSPFAVPQNPRRSLQNGVGSFVVNIPTSYGMNEVGSLDGYSSDDAESIIARNPRQHAPQPILKPAVIHFLANKVSNKDMLKVREELMKLKDNDDYFKMTSLTPLAAGLLEQMLCRNFPRQT